MSVCFNKKTWVWETTDTPENLTPTEDWIIDPIYSPNEEACKAVGPNYWTYSENVISPKTHEEIAAQELAAIKADMWKKIQIERDRRKSNGVKVGENWYHSDDTSRIQQIGLVMFGENMPTGIMWKTLSGSFVQMTPTLALQIFSAVAASDMAIFAKAEYHKAQMMASSNPASYDYLTDWPLSYGE